MKKNFKYMTGAGALMLLTSVASVSCTEDNDWDVDSSHDRLFSVVQSNLSVSEGTTTADVKWSKTPNTEYYIIQLSTDSLYDEVNLDSINVITYGEDASITGSSYTITDLIGSTRYFLRIKAASSVKAESKWTYLEKLSFKTKAEQILNAAENVTGRSALITWSENMAVTHLIVTYNVNDEAQRDSLVLSDEAIAAGQYQLTDLLSKKTYNVSIWNNDTQRGSIKFTTTEAYPDGFDVVRIESQAALHDLFTNPASYIKDNDGNMVVVLPAGSTLDYTDPDLEFTVPAQIKSIVFWGESGAETPVFKPKGLSFAGDHSYVRFYNLDLQNKGNDADYVVNLNTNGSIGELLIENCSISKSRGVVRVQSAGAEGNIATLTINNCLIDDIGSYGIINSKVSGSFAWGNINLTNSTFTSVNAGGIIQTQQGGFNINIENCTFYNCVIAGKSFLEANKITGITVNISKTIIGKSHDNGLGVTAEDAAAQLIKATSLKIGSGYDVNATDLYTTADCPYTKNYDWGTILDYGSDILFKDPENGDYTLLKDLNAGDPRWVEE
jgi:hypothetical protein